MSGRSRQPRASERGRPTGVLIISRGDLFPPDHGAAVKIERTAWGLSHAVGTVALVTDDRRRYYLFEQGQMREQRYPRWLGLAAPPQSLVRAATERLGVPHEDAFLYFPWVDPSFSLRAAYVARRHPVDLFQAEFPAYARSCLQLRRWFGGRTLLVEHNVEYQRLADQPPGLTPRAFARLRRFEIELCRKVDAVVAVSERDRDRLAADGADASHIHVIPHGVDLERFDLAAPAPIRAELGLAADRPLLVYHGIYRYPPNREAMEAMAREVLPRLHARGLRPLVLAVGRDPPAERLHPDLWFTGPVEHVAPYLLAADVAVVPLLHGGGTRMKVLDYFAARLPVVATSKGVEGIPIEHGVQALIEDDWDRFADAIAGLLADRGRAAALGAAGRAFADSLGWKAIAQRYLELFP